MQERGSKGLPIEYQELLDDIVREETRAYPDVLTPQDKIGNIWAMLINSENEDMLAQMLGIDIAKIREIASKEVLEGEQSLMEIIDQTFALASIMQRRHGKDYQRIWDELQKPNVYLRNKTPIQTIMQGKVHLVLLATKIR